MGCFYRGVNEWYFGGPKSIPALPGTTALHKMSPVLVTLPRNHGNKLQLLDGTFAFTHIVMWIG